MAEEKTGLPDSTNWKLDYIRRYPLLALLIFIIAGWSYTGKMFVDHLIEDAKEEKIESGKKDEVIKMWRDLKIQSDRDVEFSNRKKDTVYVK